MVRGEELIQIVDFVDTGAAEAGLSHWDIILVTADGCIVHLSDAVGILNGHS